MVRWSEDRKPQCSGPQGQRIPWSNAMGTRLQTGAVKGLEQYARQRVPHLVTPSAPRRTSPAAASCCAMEWNSNPVQNPRSLAGRLGRHDRRQPQIGRVGGTAEGRRGAQASGAEEDVEVLTRRAFVKTWSVPYFPYFRRATPASLA